MTSVWSLSWAGWLGLFALAGHAALAQAPPSAAEPSRVMREAVAIGSMRVPLPTGDWQVLAAVAYPFPARPAPASAAPASAALASPALTNPASTTGAPPSPAASAAARTDTGTIRSLILGRIVGGRLQAMIAIRANMAPAPAGFGPAPDCSRRDVSLARIDTQASSGFTACSMIAHVLHGTATNTDPAWRAALAALERSGLAPPPVWLLAGFRLADDDDVLDIRYLFDPALLGLADPPLSDPLPPPAPGYIAGARNWVLSWIKAEDIVRDPRWQASVWSPLCVAEDSRRAWVIAQLAGWTDATRTPVRLGFKGRATPTLPWPAPWDVAFGYAPPPAAPPPVTAGAAVNVTMMWKNLSWRTAGSMLDGVVGYVITGSLQAASSLLLVGGIVNAAGFYVHEQFWRGTTGPGAERSFADLPAVGIDR